MGWPLIVRPTNSDPAPLTLNVPVELLKLVVLTDLIALAVIKPFRRVTPCVVADEVDALPVLVGTDAAKVSMVPVLRTFGTFTDAVVLALLTPVREMQPMPAAAEGPDATTFPTSALVP
jgi:hypothetical protein